MSEDASLVPRELRWTAREEWALAVGAILNEINGGGHRFIGGAPRSPRGAVTAKSTLGEWWNIKSNKRLRMTLDELGRGEGAWDHCRRVNVAGWGYRVGWLDEVSFFEVALDSAAFLQRRLHSWAELAASYWKGYASWSGDPAADRREVLATLLKDPRSPWLRLPWDLDLDDPNAMLPRARATAPHADGIGAWTDARRFLLSLGTLQAVLELQAAGSLGRTPPTPANLTTESHWFHEENRTRDFVIRRSKELYDTNPDGIVASFLAIAQRVRAGEALDDACTTEREQRWVQKLLDDGEEPVAAAVRAHHAFFATDLVRRGVTAGLVSHDEGWSLLTHGADVCRTHLSSWEQLRDGHFDCLAMEHGREHPLRDAAIGALAASPAALYRPRWDTPCDKETPVAMPPHFESVALSIAVDCAACGRARPVDRLGGGLRCSGCGDADSLAPERLRAALADELFGSLATPTPWRFLFADPRMRIAIIADGPTCTGCGEPLDLAPWLRGDRHPQVRLRRRDETDDTFTCRCGLAHPVQLPGDRMRALSPNAVLLLLDPPPPKVNAAPLATTCGDCDAMFTVDGTKRIVACPACRALNYVETALWRVFHPVSPIPRLRLIVVPEPRLHMPDARYVFTHRAASGGGTVDRGMSGWRVDLPRSGPVPPPPSPDQRFLLQLGAIDIARAGGDPARLGGFPPTASFRSAAHERVDAIESWTASLTEAIDEATRTRQRGRKGDAAVREATRRALALANVGFLTDRTSADALWTLLAPIASAVRQRFSDWASYWGDPSISDELTRWGLADEVAWSTPHIRATDRREIVKATMSRRCHRCFRRTPIMHLEPEQRCAHCNERVPLESLELAEVLAHAVFFSRHHELAAEGRFTDYRTDGDWEVAYTRSAAIACRCGTLTPASAIEPCGGCDHPFEVRDMGALSLAMPRVLGWVASTPPTSSATQVTSCNECRGSVPVDPQRRHVDCPYCHTSLFIPERTWRSLHPRPRLTALHLVVRWSSTAALPDCAGSGWSREMLQRGGFVGVHE